MYLTFSAVNPRICGLSTTCQRHVVVDEFKIHDGEKDDANEARQGEYGQQCGPTGHPRFREISVRRFSLAGSPIRTDLEEHVPRPENPLEMPRN